jgi:uncharacterized protein YbjT (DUF2867 family)
MSALLAGATGLVGRALAAQWRGSEPLHLLVRRALPANFPQQSAQRVHVVDFEALPPLPAATHAWCCLGTTLATAGSPQAFRAVDLHAVLAFARAAQAAGVRHFAAVSALGADARSSQLYARTKGEAEAALQDLGFHSLVLARPSLLTGDRAALGQPARRAERLAQALAAPLARITPLRWRAIEADVLASALLRALHEARPGVHVLENAALHRLGGPEEPA